MTIWQTAFLGRSTRLSLSRERRPIGDIESLRRAFRKLPGDFSLTPFGAKFGAGRLGRVPCEWVGVEGAARHRVILYCHGGSYVWGSAKDHRAMLARLCVASQANAFSVDYRLAPEFAFPAGLSDIIEAYCFLLQSGIPASHIVLAGDGAGGGLVFACLLALRNANVEMPAAALAMSPWADLSLSGLSLLQNAHNDSVMTWEMLFMSARHYLKKHSPTDPYASPIFAPFNGFPPVMLQAGSKEILRDDASRLGERAADANVPVSVDVFDGMQHMFQASGYLPESQTALDRLGEFVRQHVPDKAQRNIAA